MEFPCEVVFIIEDDGDRAVGLGGSKSIVTTMVADEDHFEDVREGLKTTFSDLHGFDVSVITEQEFNEAIRQEQEQDRLWNRQDAIADVEEYFREEWGLV